MSSVEKKSAVFQWSMVEHRQYLSACLPTFPQELVNLIGSLVPLVLEWSEAQKSAGIVLSLDGRGRRRVARHSGRNGDWHSVMSQQPLSPSSSSASSPPSSSSPERCSVAAFEVRVHRQKSWMHIGVVGGLPPADGHVGVKGFGVDYRSDGNVILNGFFARRDGQKVKLAEYGAGDVIRVEVDFSAKTLAFFKNGVLQNRPIDVSRFIYSGIDFSKPLYAAVTMYKPGEQVTML